MQRLKAALWFAIGKIVDEETLELGVNATPQFIGSLTEMVWAQIGTRYSVNTCSVRRLNHLLRVQRASARISRASQSKRILIQSITISREADRG